jgi:hypothetical protein
VFTPCALERVLQPNYFAVQMLKLPGLVATFTCGMLDVQVLFPRWQRCKQQQATGSRLGVHPSLMVSTGRHLLQRTIVMQHIALRQHSPVLIRLKPQLRSALHLIPRRVDLACRGVV